MRQILLGFWVGFLIPTVHSTLELLQAVAPGLAHFTERAFLVRVSNLPWESPSLPYSPPSSQIRDGMARITKQ
jgi:hypothetical protein